MAQDTAKTIKIRQTGSPIRRRGDQRAIAVALAPYAAREAAVIVLQQPDGSYAVWVVARTCRPGADGTIAERTVTP